MFFAEGVAPGKNADAIRKVLDQLSLENEDEEDQEMADAAEPVLPLIDAEPTKKKDKKKKRKLEEVEMDGDDGSEGEPVKKVKLSKEEKKALKKEKKRERKEQEAKEAAEVSPSRRSPFPLHILFALGHTPNAEKAEKAKGREGYREEEQALMPTTLNPYIFILFFFTHTVAFLHICKLCFVHVISLLWSCATLFPHRWQSRRGINKMMVYCYIHIRLIIRQEIVNSSNVSCES